MTTATEKKTAEVQVDLADIINGDFEAFLDLLVEKAFYPYASAYDIDSTSCGRWTPGRC